MSIYVDEKNKIFKLDTKSTTYMMQVVDGDYLAHTYYGKKVPDKNLSYLLRLDEHPLTLSKNIGERVQIMENIPLEYSFFGVGDFREPCLKVLDNEGNSIVDLKYLSYKTHKGKEKIPSLPATYADESQAETLEIILIDKRLNLEVTLFYTAFNDIDAITRSVRVKNNGIENINLTRVLSACVDFDNYNFDVITAHGAWARENHIERTPIRKGKQSIDSTRGVSSPQNNPFMILCSHNTDESTGEAYGFSFVYSGNFLAEAEVSQFDRTRFVMGINSLDFNWLLKPEEIFNAPEVVMVYSDEGLGKMSRTFHDLYRENLIRGEYKHKRRPILINNWEATYFNFNEEKIYDIAKEAKTLGIEMFVLDDGWFGKRNDDKTSLGDWFVNEEKLKGGLKPLVDKINGLGMKFGLWFEPEAISEKSKLFAEHSDWTIQVKNQEKTQSRNQYVLDFSRKEVVDYIFEMMTNVLDNANIEYVKWDMNRLLTDASSCALPSDRQREIWHRYVLGVYDLMDRITSRYPKLLLENCSSGGARFDPGMLYYSPQIWTSDNADAYERLFIQQGTSLIYPCSAMGAHVSDCPNHIVGRNTDFNTRARVALVGTFGYELDVTKIPKEERELIPVQIEEFKKYNNLVREGDHYRIGDISKDNTFDAWSFVSKDKSEALLEFVQVLARSNHRSRRLKLKGLDSNAYYYEEHEPNVLISGEALMNGGYNIKNLWGDFQSDIYHFVRK